MGRAERAEEEALCGLVSAAVERVPTGLHGGIGCDGRQATVGSFVVRTGLRECADSAAEVRDGFAHVLVPGHET